MTARHREPHSHDPDDHTEQASGSSSSSSGSPVLRWPPVSVLVRPGGQAEVTITGTSHPIPARSVGEARVRSLDFVRAHAAQPLDRPVLVEARDPDGQWHLVVHPDGRVHPADESPSPRVDRPAGQPAPNPSSEDTSAAGDAALPHPSTPPEPPVVDVRHQLAPGSCDDQHVRDDAAPCGAPPAYPSTEPQAQDDIAAPWQTTPSTQPPHDCADQAPAGTHAAPTDAGPTLDDLLASRPTPRPGPARAGWQGTIRRLSGGLIRPTPGPAELAQRSAVAAVQRRLNGPRTIVIVNPKGGASKTTATLLIAATFGTQRGGYTLAWDNNETRGTLGWRAHPAQHTNTAVDLLRDLHRFTDPLTARVGDLDHYVRTQGSARFDVLASDEDAASAASIDAAAFGQLHTTLARFYRLLIIDTGNNMRASNWHAALEAADQLVVVSTIREDTAQSAAWLLDGLRANGHGRTVANAVTVLTAPSRRPDPALTQRLHLHFGKLTRTVLDVPHDTTLVDGGPINHDTLSPTTRTAWLHVSAAIADGL
ncbi:MAG: chromosome partitioning protein [Angustibacter sp.]